MAENKTRPTDASVATHIAAIDDASRQRDCEILVGIMTEITQQPPQMWGSSIVGFGTYHYVYKSGREGDMCITGFASRKASISIYLLASGARQDELLIKLGKHRMGKGCLYVKRLADVDTRVLQQLIEGSVAEVKRRYGSRSGA